MLQNDQYQQVESCIKKDSTEQVNNQVVNSDAGAIKTFGLLFQKKYQKNLVKGL